MVNDPKKLYAKHLIYPCRQVQRLENKSKKTIQPNIKQKDYNLNANYTHRTIFSKHNFINDLTKHSQSLISTLSPKSDKKIHKPSKTSGPQTPSKTSDTLISITVKYKSKNLHIDLDKRDDGLSLASKIDIDLSLELSNAELELLALKLTNELNMIIDTLHYTKQHNNHSSCNDMFNSSENALMNYHTSGNHNLNWFVIDLNDLLTNNSKIKIAMKFGNSHFCYYITNTPEEIEDVIEDMIAKIDYNEKYDKDSLKKQLGISMNDSISKALKK